VWQLLFSLPTHGEIAIASLGLKNELIASLGKASASLVD
jgi:hypothetical protein